MDCLQSLYKITMITINFIWMMNIGMVENGMMKFGIKTNDTYFLEDGNTIVIVL